MSNPNITGPKNYFRRILILGNSITLHRPKPASGWHNCCGMAATCLEKDFAHLLLAQLTAFAGGVPSEAWIDNIADYERTYEYCNQFLRFGAYAQFQPDALILAIGENIPQPETPDKEKVLQRSLVNLIQLIAGSRKPAVFLRSNFWADESKDRILRAAAAETGATYIDISALRDDPACFSAPGGGFGGHPGDYGMKKIADAVAESIRMWWQSR